MILDGGGGTRLWPVSRDSFPKQFLKILEPTSSLQQAVPRTSAKDIFARPIVMRIGPYRITVRQQLGDPLRRRDRDRAERRDSGPAILAAALLMPPETVLFVSAADHLIRTRTACSPISTTPPRLLQAARSSPSELPQSRHRRLWLHPSR